MSFGLEDHEWLEPDEPQGVCDCTQCKHCKDVWSGTDWFYCDVDAQLALQDAHTPEQVLKAFIDAWIDIEDCSYCQHFEQDK